MVEYERAPLESQGARITRVVFRQNKARLKGIGLAFGNKFGLIAASGIDSIQTADSFTKLYATIITPPQTAADGTNYSRPAVTLGNVGLHYQGTPQAFTDGPAIENLTPFGDWEIQLHPLAVWKDWHVQMLKDGIGGQPIRDLKIMFRAYVPSA